MRKQSPAFSGTDGESYPVLDVFVPDIGERQATASLLVDAATDNGFSQSHIRSDAARGGFWISNDLADIVYDDSTEEVPEEEPAPKAPAKAPAKTGSTAKKGTKKS